MSNKTVFPILALISLAFGKSHAPAPTTSSYIGQSGSLAAVTAAVSAQGATIPFSPPQIDRRYSWHF